MATAWQIAQQVHGGATPVALVAQDRALVRRVRALLERLHIEVVDETGWSLATTRAGAHATAALRAARAADSPANCRSCGTTAPWGGAGRSVQIASIGLGSVATRMALTVAQALARRSALSALCSQAS